MSYSARDRRVLLKAILVCALACFFVVALSQAQTPVSVGTPVTMPLVSKAAIVIDAASGRILFEHNAHQPLPPASVTKVLTLIVALEAIQDGKVSPDELVTTSARASSMGGTQIWLETGEKMSFEEMLWAIAVGSANDAAVAVAEHLAGSEPAFAQLMNERALELGALNTHFLNASGLSPVDVGYSGEHVTSAYDMALLSRHAISLPTFIDMVSTWGPVVMRPEGSRVPELFTYNRMIRTYPGMDGIKTGFTSQAGYGLSASAVRDGVRVITVTLGAPTSPGRDDDVRRLLDFGFSQLRSTKLYAAGDVIDQLRVTRGEPAVVDVKVADDVFATMLRSETEEPVTTIEWMPDGVTAPLEAGQQVGTLIVKIGDIEVARGAIVTAHHVRRASWTQIILRNARRLLARDI